MRKFLLILILILAACGNDKDNEKADPDVQAASFSQNIVNGNRETGVTTTIGYPNGWIAEANGNSVTLANTDSARAKLGAEASLTEDEILILIGEVDNFGMSSPREIYDSLQEFLFSEETKRVNDEDVTLGKAKGVKIQVDGQANDGYFYVLQIDRFFYLVVAQSGDLEKAATNAESILTTLAADDSEPIPPPSFICRFDDTNCYGSYLNVERGTLDDGTPYIGSLAAPIVLSDFSDFSCPHCANFDPTIERLVDEFVSSGQLRIEFRAITGVRPPFSETAAIFAYCSGDAFWQVYSVLFELHRTETFNAFNHDRLLTVADEMGLDRTEIEACMASDAPLQTLTASRQAASRLNVASVPSVFYSTDNGATWESVAADYDAIRAIIEG